MPLLDMAVLCGLLVLAAILRFDRLDLAQFKNDEARALALATQIARGEAFPLVGIPSSAGPQNGPGFPYLLALPLLVQRDALFATGFIGALNIAAVGLTYVLVRRHFGRLAAGIAALLFAVGFWPVTFSRFLWAQNTLPFFSALIGLMLLEAVTQGRRWLFPSAAALVGLMSQLHFSALAHAPLLVLLGALFHRRLGTVAIVSIPTFLLALAPYLWGETTHGGENLRHMTEMASGSFVLHVEPLLEPFRLMGSDSYDRWLGEGEQALRAAAAATFWSNRFEAALALLGLLYALWHGIRLSLSPLFLRQTPARVARQSRAGRVWRQDEGPAHLVLALWAIVPMAVFLYTPFPVYEHYLIGLLPALFALAGVGGAWLLGSVTLLIPPTRPVMFEDTPSTSLRTGPNPARGGFAPCGLPRSVPLRQLLMGKHPFLRWERVGARGVTVAITTALLLALLWTAISQVAFNRAALDAQQGEVRPSGRGVPLGDLRAALRLLTTQRDSDRWLITREDLREPLSALSRLDGNATPLGGGALVARAAPQQAYLMIEGSGAAGDFLELDMASFLTAKRETPNPAANFRLYVVPTELMDAAARQGSPVQRATTAGIDLLSIAVESTVRQGAVLSVRLGWMVREAPPSLRKRYRFFAHLVADPASPPLAQEDGIGYPSERWQRGEIAITWLPIALPGTLPPADYLLRIGMYDLDTGAPASFLSGDGRPSEAWLLFGPIRVTP